MIVYCVEIWNLLFVFHALPWFAMVAELDGSKQVNSFHQVQLKGLPENSQMNTYVIDSQMNTYVIEFD